jgi:YaiO family outer membrane protein
MKKNKIIFKILIVLNVIFIQSATAQNTFFTGDPDEAFAQARELAFNKQRSAAQDTLRLILTKYPTYLDVRSFLASTYAWDGNYKLARKQFKIILKKDNTRKKDWIAAINNEFWAENPYKALDLTEDALGVFNNDSEILLLKALAEEKTKNTKEALATINGVLKNEPNNTNAIKYRDKLKLLLSYNTIGIRSSVNIYNKNERDLMEFYTLNYSRDTRFGSIITKVNIDRRFGDTGIQYELDMYPSLGKGLYAYVSGGFSNTSLFPNWRYGAELYKNLPKSFEASLGFRGLKYSGTTMIYTGSVGWYTGNAYWSFRTYVTPGGAGTSKSGTLSYRKYRADANNYFSVGVGLGFSPEFDPYPINETNVPTFDLKSQKIDFGYFFSTENKKHFVGTRLGVSREEKINDRDNYFLVFFLGLSYDVKFK